MSASLEDQFLAHRKSVEAMEARLGDDAQRALAAKLLRDAGVRPRTAEQWKSYHQSANAWVLAFLLFVVWAAVAGPKLGLF